LAIIIFPPTFDWTWMTQRPQQLMKQFAKDGHKVFFCNHKQSRKKRYSTIRQNLTIVHNNNHFIKNLIPRLKETKEKIILWVSWPKLHTLIDEYRPDIVVFDYIDDFPDWSPFVPRMVEKADILISSATILKEQLEGLRLNKPIFLIPNAAECEHFNKYRINGITPKKPIELDKHKGPIIGYMGSWANWVDDDLFYKVAETYPEVLISIIGTEFGKKVNTTVSNIVYSGMIDYDFLPQYLFYFDICLIPFKKNKITLATNPVKIYEYLAAGKPVVSTDIPEVLGIPGVFVGEDTNSFLEKIDGILSSRLMVDQDNVDKWLEHNSWEKRYQDIKKILLNYL
jgi:teichuronic acid biosynthesis glycosyltransferase TuaH